MDVAGRKPDERARSTTTQRVPHVHSDAVRRVRRLLKSYFHTL